MKILYKHSLYVALSALLCVFLAQPSQAQRGATGGGGGGGRSSGGGGGGSVSSSGNSSSNTSTSTFSRPSTSGSTTSSFSRPSSGGGSYSRPSAGSVGISRPSFNPAPRQGVVNGQGGVRGNYGYAPRQGTSVRGNYGYAPRQGTVGGFTPRQGTSVSGLGFTPRGATSGGLTYRTAPRIGYGGYWGNHGYYHYNRGYYGTYYLPSIGFTCGYLPYGYYPFYYGDDEYFFSNGLFYQYYNDSYTVVEPPVGAEVDKLPAKAQSIVIDGQQYYEYNGVYYQPITKDNGQVAYEVAGKDGVLNTGGATGAEAVTPKVGDITYTLPEGCKKLKLNGQVMFVSDDGIYYQETTDADGKKVDISGKQAIALCRCGASTNKPFCDGTHSKIGFLAAEAAVKTEG